MTDRRKKVPPQPVTREEFDAFFRAHFALTAEQWEAIKRGVVARLDGGAR